MREPIRTSSNTARTVEWYVDSPRRRSFFTAYGVASCEMPSLAYMVINTKNGFQLLNVYAIREPQLTDDTILYRFPTGHDHGGVCLGEEAYSEILNGRLHPIDAFWLTRFDHNFTKNEHFWQKGKFRFYLLHAQRLKWLETSLTKQPVCACLEPGRLAFTCSYCGKTLRPSNEQ